MRKRIRSGLTYANVMSTFAVFLILGGATAFAANQLAKNSVGSKQLKKNAVGMAKIKSNAVNGAKVADGSLEGIDVKDASLTGTDLADGSVALADLAANSVNGSKVVDGSLGKADVAAGTFLGGKVTVQSTEAAADLADGAKVSIDAFCPAGQVAIGGGGRGDDQNSEETNVGSSRPIISPENAEPPANGEGFSGWRLTVNNPTGGVAAVIRPKVWVICAALP